MRILVTGGLGVNGSWVTRKLVERGLDPVVLENRIDTSLLGRDTASEVEIVEGDVTDFERLKEVLIRCRIQRVIHMAALIGGMQEAPLHGFNVNALGSVLLYEAASRAGVERVVLTSSRAVYGHIDGEWAHPTYTPVSEDHPLRPVRVYDVCKVASEGMGRNYKAAKGLQFLALRFAHIYGPGKLSRHEALGMMSRMVEDPMRGLPVRVAKGGEQRDDLIYVDDAAEGIVAAALHPNPSFDAYNIASNVGSSLDDVADAVRRVIPAADIEIGPGIDYHGMGVSYCGRLDNRRATEDLGFTPRFDLASGIADYVEAISRYQLPLGPG